MVISGKASHELEVEVPASQAWELYGTLGIARLVEQSLSDVISKIEVEQGDGEQGTILKLTFAPGIPGPGWHKEKFTMVDNEKRVKEVEVVEGGYRELGFTFYLIRFEITEAGSSTPSSCIIKTTVEYELKEEAAAMVSFVSVDLFANIAQIAKHHLLKKHTEQLSSQVLV
ncbi:PREDICTED: S-norcoclaurine synthase-like isoform X1 [Fragaria vesca subsp. vesca]|uniref:S-norcoclaurine synthase-like isoform X1 n=1 Tax=Fragaria vesca subsp. vesca TaxID=101020 RepID=UPI0002C37431|nr:PREDICTED: S-norcoclaurine synthase-like isoform X1 [Fragaria vesca subsp. vesca]